MKEFSFSELAGFITVITVGSALVLGVLKFIINDIYDFKNSNKRKEESKNSLTSVM